MNADISALFSLIVRSFTHPREVAEQLTSRRYDRVTLWSMMALVIVLTAIIFSASAAISPPPAEMSSFMFTPLVSAILVGSFLVMLVFMLYFTGRMMGGTGHFPETIVIVVWNQAITIAYQVVQIVLFIFSPLLGSIATLVGFVFLFYIMLQFIDVLHGFQSLLKAFGAFVFAVVGIAFGLAVILSFIGASAATLG